MQRRAATPLLLLAAGLALAGAPASAIDPGTVRGHLQLGTQRHELSHVQAVRVPGRPGRLNQVLGTLRYAGPAGADGTPSWALDASFSAPVFSPK